ncbi:hypothetical protein D3C85_1715740 [compost metagenome]
MGDEVRVSTPVSTASCMPKPLMVLSNAGSASRIAVMANSGSAVARSVRCTPGVYEGSTEPNSVDALPAMKSPTSWPGAL